MLRWRIMYCIDTNMIKDDNRLGTTPIRIWYVAIMSRLSCQYNTILIMRLRKVKDDGHILHTCTHTYALGDLWWYYIMMSWWKWLSGKTCENEFVGCNYVIIRCVSWMISLVMGSIMFIFILIWLAYLYILS